MTINVGEVIAVKGLKVILRISDESSKDTLFFNGLKYKGVSIREHVLIQRGFRDIVCVIEGEYLDEQKYENENNKICYIRKVEAKPIGYFFNDKFNEGIKYLPMIKDPVFLISESRVSQIFGHKLNNEFIIGKLLKEDFPISLPWERLFNTHIGIFGNTGSGKSNTLAKILSVLFSEKKEKLKNKSEFVLIDFNGEYTKDQLISENDKQVFDLNTSNDTGSKFPLAEQEFWNTETLCILFKATTNTQTPFISRIVRNRARYAGSLDSLCSYIKKTFSKIFTTTSPKKETLELLKEVMSIINHFDLKDKLHSISWHSKLEKFYREGTYFDTESNFQSYFHSEVSCISLPELTAFDELMIRINLQLINDLISGYVQFEHIQPLLKRIEASFSSLKRVLKINSHHQEVKILTVISLRKCNQEVKKIMPLLLAKHYYNQHKIIAENPITKTIHLIIDEAHNILSQQSMREQESWKDYRLETFEEIIKEGRKFGVFLTLASQRPADISPTIMSQIHNFFLHRLVNEKDLLLLDNTISTLDTLSKEMIPNLAKGCCIVTGTSFDLPLLLQIAQLPKNQRPDSDDVNLGELWS